MRAQVPWRWVAISLPVMVVLNAACGSQSPQAVANKSLIVEQAFGQYDSLDPARGVFPLPSVVDKSVFDTLLIVNPHDLSKPYPALATSFTQSSDAKTFTFHIRHGVKFASGDALTSADVVWSLTRVTDIKSPAAILMNGLTVSAPDQFTVVITSNAANPSVPIQMASSNGGILDSQLVQQHGGTDTGKDLADDYLNGANSAGSGPYTVTSVDRTSQIVLKANPLYWGTKPAYSTVILRNVPAATQRLDVQDGQAQLALDLTPQDATSMSSSSVNVIAAPTADQIQIGMNADPAISTLTSNQNFRDAVRYALDYKGLVALAGPGAVRSTGFIPVGILGALPASAAIQQDLAVAKSDLAKVGVTNPTIALSYYTDRPADGLNLSVIAAKIQSDLKQVGITVNLDGEPVAVLNPKVRGGKVAMAVRAFPADYPDPSDFVSKVPGPAGLVASYQHWVVGTDPAIDALVATATSATSPADRAVAYQALGKATNDSGYGDYLVVLGRALVSAKSVHAILNPFDYVDLGAVT